MMVKTLLLLVCFSLCNLQGHPWTSVLGRWKSLSSVGNAKTTFELFSSPFEDDLGAFDPGFEDEDWGEEGSDVPSYEELEATLGDWDDRVAQLNTVHLVGRVGNNPEPKYFDDGKVVVNLSLAARRKYHYLERQEMGIKSGDEETDWYGLEIWGVTAEFVSKFVDKGARVGVIGEHLCR